MIELQLECRGDFAKMVPNAQLVTCTGMNHSGCLRRGISKKQPMYHEQNDNTLTKNDNGPFAVLYKNF